MLDENTATFAGPPAGEPGLYPAAIAGWALELDIPGRLRERGLLPEQVLSIFVAGSLVRGWGNASSDVDVYVICSKPPTWRSTASFTVSAPPGVVPVQTFEVDGRSWDVEYWSGEQVEELLRQVRQVVASANDGPAVEFGYTERELLHRVSYAEVAMGAEWLAGTRAAVAGSGLHDALTRTALELLDNSTVDATGQLQAGDLESAVLSARIALDRVAEAVLASHGELTTSPKWRARALRAVDPSELDFATYWLLQTMRSYDPDDPSAWVEETLAFCQSVTTEIVL